MYCTWASGIEGTVKWKILIRKNVSSTFSHAGLLVGLDQEDEHAHVHTAAAQQHVHLRDEEQQLPDIILHFKFV